MRVCLIIPPSGFLLDERVFPTLGVLKVAAVLCAEHDVVLCDLSGCADIDNVAWPSADVYGITATTPQMPSAGRITGLLRQAHRGCRVILGGPHVTLVNSASKRGVARASLMLSEMFDVFDVLVAGDGEHAIFKALTTTMSIVDADIPQSSLFMTKQEFTDSPWPLRRLLDTDSYHYEIDGERATSVIAQLGCPFGCGFCGGRSSPTFRRMRTRSSASVVAELLHLHDTYGYNGFMFFDDELNVNRAFSELLRMIIEAQRLRHANWSLRGFVKSELLTESDAALMAEAGFKTLLVGFESGDERVLWNMQKRATVDDNTRCVEMIHQYGMRVKALMSLGHPGESAESALETQRWLLDVRPDEFDMTVITVYPGTPYFDEAAEERPDVWTYRAPKTGDALHSRSFSQLAEAPFYKGSPGDYESFVHTDFLSAEDLVKVRDTVEAAVRENLKIPYPTSGAAQQYEHSMGMGHAN